MGCGCSGSTKKAAPSGSKPQAQGTGPLGPDFYWNGPKRPAKAAK